MPKRNWLPNSPPLPSVANSERFITEELKNVENEILGAKDRVLRLEEGIFSEVRDCLASMGKFNVD